MSFKTYHVLVPKAAVADPEPLRAEAALLAKDRRGLGSATAALGTKTW